MSWIRYEMNKLEPCPEGSAAEVFGSGRTLLVRPTWKQWSQVGDNWHVQHPTTDARWVHEHWPITLDVKL